MKFTVNVDCSPEEARAFFGLPDVQPMQQALMQEMQTRMMEGMKAMEPDAMMKQWLPMSMQAFENFQKMFWSGMASNMGGSPLEGSDPARKRG
jgi:hypothetical protein